MRRATRAAVAAAAIAAALFGAGCGRGEPKQQAAEKPETKVFPARLSVRAAGDSQLRFDGASDVTVTVFRAKDHRLRLLTVGLASFLGEDATRFRTAFDLTGVYDGPGTYKIAPAAATQSSGDLSNAFLDVITLKDPAGEVVADNVASSVRFGSAAEACEVTVGKNEQTGHINCPKLADASGNAVGLRFSWKAKDSRS